MGVTLITDNPYAAPQSMSDRRARRSLAAQCEDSRFLGAPLPRLVAVIEDALHDIGARVIEWSADRRRVTAKIGVNFWSWGERLTVSADETGEVRVSSVCSFPLQVVDWGKNAENCRRVLESVASCLGSDIAVSFDDNIIRGDNQPDNPYAAPQAPPEESSGAWEVCLRAGLAGFAVFSGMFFVAVSLAFAVVVVVKDWPDLEVWYCPSFSDEVAAFSALAFSLLVAIPVGVFAIRRELRQRTVRR